MDSLLDLGLAPGPGGHNDPDQGGVGFIEGEGDGHESWRPFDGVVRILPRLLDEFSVVLRDLLAQARMKNAHC